MSPALRRAPILALALAASACAPEALTGSLSEIYDLEYDTVTLQQGETAATPDVDHPAGIKSELVLTYSRTRTAPRGVIFKLSVDTTGLDLATEQVIDLAKRFDGSGRSRVSLARALEDDAAVTFPAIERGGLELNREPLPGVPVVGSFHLLFIQHSGLKAAGRTVRGPFAVRVSATD